MLVNAEAISILTKPYDSLNGATLFMGLVWTGMYDSVLFMIQFAARFNRLQQLLQARDNNGWTFMHYAALNTIRKVTDYLAGLVNNQAPGLVHFLTISFFTPDKFGQTPLDVAHFAYNKYTEAAFNQAQRLYQRRRQSGGSSSNAIDLEPEPAPAPPPPAPRAPSPPRQVRADTDLDDPDDDVQFAGRGLNADERQAKALREGNYVELSSDDEETVAAMKRSRTEQAGGPSSAGGEGSSVTVKQEANNDDADDDGVGGPAQMGEDDGE